MGGRKVKTRKSRKVSLSKKISDEDILQSLEDIAESLNIKVRYEKGDFKGGICHIREKSVIVLKRTDTIDKKVQILAQSLNEINLSAVDIRPEIEEILDKFKHEKKGVSMEDK